ncbi:MAG: DUF4493 domain-containing protein [Cyclobacteriaceae bacterium]
MKKFSTSFLKMHAWVFALSLIAIACGRNDDQPQPTDTGFLSMNVSLSIEEESAFGRTTTGDPDEFRISVYDVNDVLVISYNRLADAPQQIELITGEYYVVAHSDNEEEAAFDNPYYYGQSANFTIDKEEVKTIDIVAELANTKVSFEYSTDVVNTFDSYSSSVAVMSTGTTLVYVQGETREGYFVSEPLAIDVNLSYIKLDGTTIDRTFSATLSDPQPKTLYKVRVDASLQDGQIVFNLIVDESFSEEVIELGGVVDPNTFEKTYGGSQDDFVYGGALQTSDGGFIVAGTSNSSDVVPNQGDYDFYLIKTDADGEVEWQNNYGTPNRDFCWGVAETTDGGYVATGSTGSVNNSDGWVVKVDGLGNLQWDQTFGTPGTDEEFFGVDILSNGNILVGGHDDGILQRSEVYTVVLDNNGTIIDETTYGRGPLSSEVARNLHATADGGFIGVGYTLYTTPIPSTNVDYYIFKVDNTGNLEWDQTYGGSADDSAWDVADIAGNYYVAGTTQSSDGDISNFQGGAFDGWLVQLDPSGNLVSERAIGGSGTDVLYGVGESSNGKVLITGTTNSTDGDIVDKFGLNPEMMYAELELNGSNGWFKHNSSIEEGRSIGKTADNGMIISTHSPFLKLFKLNASGEL